MHTTATKGCFFRVAVLMIIIKGLCCDAAVVGPNCKEHPIKKNVPDLQVHCTIPFLKDDLNFTTVSINRTTIMTLQCTQSNATSNIGNSTFTQFFRLRSLIITRCQFVELPEQMFQGLTSLQSLRIVSTVNFTNDFRLPFMVSSDLQNLTSLKLENVGIQTIPETFWNNLRNVNYLLLSQNKIDHLKWLNSLAERITNLTSLEISHNLLATLQPRAFHALPSLMNLCLDYNFIHTFQKDAFLGLYSLTTLTINNNNLMELHTDVFQNQSQLQILDLSHNNISTLVNGNFNGLNKLKKLNLGNNNIMFSDVSQIPFKNLTKLEVLILAKNNISFLAAELFHGLNAIKTLYLASNDLSNASARTFDLVSNSVEKLGVSKSSLQSLDLLRNFSKLKVLDAHDNELRILPPDYFESFQHSLEILFLSDTALKTIVKAQGRWGENAIFAKFSQLRILDLRSNLIDRFDYFMVPDNLIRLDLSINRINTLEDQFLLRSKKKIASLSINANNFQKLDSSSFSHSLQKLSCSFCNISTIQKGTFGELRRLADVKFLTSKIGKIERFAFSVSAGKPTVTPTVHFNNELCKTTIAPIVNNIQFTSFKVRRFNNKHTCQTTTYCQSGRGNNHRSNAKRPNAEKDVTSVNYIEFATLDCGSNNFSSFDVRVDKSSIVNILYIDGNFFKSLENNTFHNYTNLQYLYLNNSQVISLESGVFLGLQELLELNLNDNKIQSLHFNQFRNLHKLTVLSLQNNNLSRIDYKVLKGIKQLKTLHLDYNLLQRLNGLEFYETKGLQNLSLTNNNMTSLGRNSFIKLGELKELHLECNALTYFSPRFLAGAKQLVKLFLNDNKFGNIREHTFAVTLKLEELHLHRNEIREIRSTAFLKLMRLKKLHLEHNNLTSVRNDWFQDMHALAELYLNNNFLTDIQVDAFEGAANLAQLFIHNNSLTVIAIDALASLKFLRTLTLHNNKLSSLAAWKFPDNLKSVTLRGNEFTCNCDFLIPFRDWVIGPAGSNKVIDIDDVICKHENGSRATLPILQHTQKYCEIHSSALVTSLISSGCFITIIVISVLIYMYRLEMQVLLYSRYGFRIFYHDNDADLGKIYHAFISYSSEDEVFVAEELVRVLEPEFRLCVHGRDFPVGADITDTVFKVVERSCRTLLVLSNNFLNSEWCRYEFKIAHHQTLKDRCCRLIIILMEDVNENELDKELKIYLKTNTYLRWGDRFFWEKLKYAMPDINKLQENDQQRNE